MPVQVPSPREDPKAVDGGAAVRDGCSSSGSSDSGDSTNSTTGTVGKGHGEIRDDGPSDGEFNNVLVNFQGVGAWGMGGGEPLGGGKTLGGTEPLGGEMSDNCDICDAISLGLFPWELESSVGEQQGEMVQGMGRGQGLGQGLGQRQGQGQYQQQYQPQQPQYQ